MRARVSSVLWAADTLIGSGRYRAHTVGEVALELRDEQWLEWASRTHADRRVAAASVLLLALGAPIDKRRLDRDLQALTVAARAAAS